MDPSSKPSSPAWRNPRDVMRKSIGRRKSSSRCLNSSLSAAASPSTQASSLPSPLLVDGNPSFSTASPSLNPFRRSPRKRRVVLTTPEKCAAPPPDWDDSTANDSFNSPLLSSLQSNAKRRALDRTLSFGVPEDTLGELYPLDFSGTEFSGRVSKSKEQELRSSASLPIDFRLGTKIRIVSKKPFPWMKNTKSTGNVIVRVPGPDRYHGLKTFVSYIDGGEADCPSFSSASSALSIFETASLYWQFPTLPWMSFFPRAESLTKNALRGSHLPKEQQEVICTEWQDCFDQLFLSWKKGQRQSFYVCAPLFTVLFTKVKGSEDDPAVSVSFEDSQSQSCFPVISGLRHVAVVSHTNYYVRQLFKKEGIKFDLIKAKKCSRHTESDLSHLIDDVTQSQPPLLEFATKGDAVSDEKGDQKCSQGMASTDSEEDPDENSPTKTMMENARWLRGQGVSPGRIRKWTRHSSLDSFSARSLDDRKPNTVVVKESASLQALFNVLLTDRCVRSLSGPMAGLPPTLLAPQSFVHAHMLGLKRASQVVKRGVGDTDYVCELEGGPVLPASVAAIAEFVRRASLTDQDHPVTIKVNDRSACNGLNAVMESNEEWTEITVEPEVFTWKISSDK